MNEIHNYPRLDLNQFYRLDINLYPLFIAIYEQQSISQAAHILCISQSAVSHALQRLRTHLKDDLFVRSGQKMRPTPLSDQIYPSVKHALIVLQHVSQQDRPFNPRTIQKLKIAVHDEIEPIILPKIIAHFAQLNLDIQFFSCKLDRKNMNNDLVTQQIDLVIDLAQERPKLEFQLLLEDHFVVCSQQEMVNSEIYLNAPHIGVSSRRTGQLVEDIYLHRQHLCRQIFLRCQHYATALQILAQHPTAMLTIPLSILQHLQYAEPIIIHPLPIELPRIGLGMFWHSSLEHNPRHQFLRTELTKIFTEELT